MGGDGSTSLQLLDILWCIPIIDFSEHISFRSCSILLEEASFRSLLLKCIVVKSSICDPARGIVCQTDAAHVMIKFAVFGTAA